MNFMPQLCIFISLLVLSQSIAVPQIEKDWTKHHHKTETICTSHLNGTILPHPTDCHKFYVCVKNEPIEYNCDTNFHFDISSRSCLAGNTCDDISLENPNSCDEGSIQSVADDCYIFETCVNGQYQKFNCPSGHYFSASHSVCRPIHYNAHFKCNCMLPEHTVMENHENCETFYVCEAKKPVLQKCPLDQYYNSNINACLPDLDGVCLMHPTMVPLDELHSAVELLIETAAEAACKRLGNQEVHFQDYEGDCNKFYVCANGQLYLQECPKGFYYDADLKYCVLDTENKCINDKLTSDSTKSDKA